MPKTMSLRFSLKRRGTISYNVSLITKSCFRYIFCLLNYRESKLNHAPWVSAKIASVRQFKYVPKIPDFTEIHPNYVSIFFHYEMCYFTKKHRCPPSLFINVIFICAILWLFYTKMIPCDNGIT